MSDERMISIVTPAYNEAEVIDSFLRSVTGAMGRLGVRYEIIIVDDGSEDETAKRVRDARTENTNIKLITFSRNFGQSAAISAGLDYASGDAVIIMDADLQDRPEVFAEFVKKWDEGYEVVFAVRTRRKERGLKRFAYWFFYRALQLVFPVRIPLDSGDFSLIDRRVVDVIKHAPERNRFMRGLRAWAGFRQVGIEVERGSREAGRSKYTVRKLFRLAADGVFSFSYVPLRLATWFGFCIAGTGFLVILVLLYLRIFTGVLPVTGFTSIIVAILFLGGIQLVAIGLLGEYVGRIYDEVKSRPLYLVREREGFSDTHHEA